MVSRIYLLQIQRRPGEAHGTYRIVQTKRRFSRSPAVLQRLEGAAWLPEDLSTWIDQPSLQGALQGFVQSMRGYAFKPGTVTVGRFDLLEDGRCGLKMSEEFAAIVRSGGEN